MPPAIIPLLELQLHAGEEIGVSDWIEIAQDRIAAFADTTLDRQWIHVDPLRAARDSPFGGSVAHGFLILSLVPHLMSSALTVSGKGMAINYGLNRVRFTAPVPAGSRIRARFALSEVADVAGAIQIIWKITVEREGVEKPACVAEMISRYFPAPA